MSHDHHNRTNYYNRSFAIGVILNVVFVAIEAGYGIFADSLALISDAGHNLSDVASLLLAWGASILATKAVSEKRTYGFRKATIMASLVSAILLLIALGGITLEAIGRFLNPKSVDGMTVIVVASIGVVINTLTALLFIKGQKDDLNIKGAFLHMAADAGVSLGVVVAGIFMILYGWLWIDPVMSLMIVVVILFGTWGLLKDSLNYAMDAVPESIDIPAIRTYLMSFDHVNCIHDLHVWPLSTTETALTVHIMVNDDALDNNFLLDLQRHLNNHFGIAHSTIQFETSMGENDCMLDSDKCGQQETGKAIYSFMDVVAWEAEHYAAGHTSPMAPLLEEIERYTLKETDYPSMLTGRVEGRFLQLIVALSGFRDVVDIGTFTGYSALAMAESVPPDGKVVTIEHNPANAVIAQGFFDRSPHGKKITLQRGEAIDILKSLPSEATDLVFIDADKASYLDYYHESMRILREGGLIIADNALWYGKIFDPKDEESKAMALFNEEVNADNRTNKLFLTLRDGIYLIRKKTT